MINSVFIALSLALSPQHTLAAHTHLQTLSHDQFGGRKTGSHHAKMTAQYIAAHFKNAQLNPVFTHYSVPFTYSSMFNEKTGQNVIAAMPHISNKPYVVITAHYDHLGTKGRNIYNGADDNATGIAALLTFASLIAKQTKRNLNYLFVATDAEELGLFGAREFVKTPPVPLSNMLIHINLDMLGVSRRNRLLGLYTLPVKPFIASLRSVEWHTSSNVKFTRGNGFYDRGIKNQRRRILDAGDHREFHRQNIPILYFGVGEHKHYHTPNDTYDNLDHNFYNGNLHNIAKVITLLDANYPLLNRH